MSESKKDPFNTAIGKALEVLSDSTGKNKNEILDLWFPIFESRDLYVKKCKEASDLTEIDLLLNQLEKDITFEILWIQNALGAVQSWKEANSDVRKAESRLSEIKFLKQMNRINDDVKKYTSKLDYSQENVKKELRKTDPYVSLLNSIDSANYIRVTKGIWRIRKSVFKYEFYRWSRHFLRVGLKVFWGLMVFSIGFGALKNLIPIWYLSLIFIPTILWVFQKKYFEPWLNKKVLNIQRIHLNFSIHKLYAAQWLAYNYLILECNNVPEDINPLFDIGEKPKSEK